uniref:Glycosyltransferase family 2 protein n=1 Tax=Fervidobacterium pennivorans TaxID=93466 RepID=A0A7V4KC18_FERPE
MGDGEDEFLQPAVSIIIPAYNVENYISATLESVKRQTYKNIEVIVVNDGSKDSTSEVAKRVLSNSDFAWIVIDQENQGVSVARNVGLSEASGEYVLFLDGDDIVSDSFIEKMYEKAKESNCDIVFCKYAMALQEARGLTILHTYDDFFSHSVHRRFEKCTSGQEVLRETTKHNIWIWTGSAIYRRAFLADEKLSFVPGRWVGEDIEFIFKALFKAKRVASVSEVLVFYIQREGSTVNSQGREWEKMLAVKEVFDCLERFFEGERIDKKTKKLLRNYSRVHIWYHVKNVYDRRKIEDEKVFDEFYAYAKWFKPIGGPQQRLFLFVERILISLFPGKVALKVISFLRRAKRLVKETL